MTGDLDMILEGFHTDRARNRDQTGLGSITACSRRRNPREDAFTLIEIMAVVLIMGFLAGIVGVAVVGQIERARVTTAKTQIKQLEAALTFYQMENGFFPDTDQGLDALVEKPTSGRVPRSYREGGYLKGGEVPLDPWQNPYQYESPGRINRDYDIWSLGADGVPGGADSDADIGNWPEGMGEG
jgi:general secretion pathway protein G